MRPPRILILTFFFFACLFLLIRSVSSQSRSQPPVVATPVTNAPRSGFRAFFSFSTPFTLFPPNAIITIADDNSTSFAARPAAFGPPLPSKGLNGRLWIGSGFTEETLQDGEGEGELGCADVTGWDETAHKAALRKSLKASKDKYKSGSSPGKGKNLKRGDPSNGPMVDRMDLANSRLGPKKKTGDDGTDDYLHEDLRNAPKIQNDGFGSPGSGHADIQSIQEGAEIAGKIVLLSRGGCGFLEKVKWAQRRGAIALIVGDNQRGGPLIQMYAKGDTSNVSIPSIFTSRTTAYLLSLMMQPGSFIEEVDENGNPLVQVQHIERSRKKAQQDIATVGGIKSTSSDGGKSSSGAKAAGSEGSVEPDIKSRSSWIAGLFNWGSRSKAPESSRPPTSGQHDWVLVEEFSDERDKVIKNGLDKASKSGSEKDGKGRAGNGSGDGFQIGVHDWRDPDLVNSPNSSPDVAKPNDKTSGIASSKVTGKKAKDPNGPKGGSITPGSGEYSADAPAVDKNSPKSKGAGTSESSSKGGLISKIFGEGSDADSSQSESGVAPINTPIVEIPTPGGDNNPPPVEEREGLWIVITPTSSASPFFDTLLVLVISPLITLTVVYALLILRARIRRRRWRAPKSVVERLPVRTYHTVSSTPSRSPRLQSPSPPSPTTPLLQSQHGPSRPRPRSRTTTGVPSAGDLLQVNTSLQTPPPPSHEKAHSSEWKKYMGRQVECVVCLEEYVDGVSQVMSLPCGHEFHVDCITPWLTTRRRTCPICKGDVVRSLARGMPSSPRYEPYRDDSDDDFLAQASSSEVSPRATSGRRDDVEEPDVEHGILSPVPRSSRRQGQNETWLGQISSSLRAIGAFTPRPSTHRDSDEDRDR